MKTKTHPMQPIEYDNTGVIRFKRNSIVRYLLDKATAAKVESLNTLLLVPFSQEDWDQFYQLIGYSVSGYGDLDFISKTSVRKADRKAAELYKKEKGE